LAEVAAEIACPTVMRRGPRGRGRLPRRPARPAARLGQGPSRPRERRSTFDGELDLLRPEIERGGKRFHRDKHSWSGNETSGLAKPAGQRGVVGFVARGQGRQRTVRAGLADGLQAAPDSAAEVPCAGRRTPAERHELASQLDT